MAWGKDKGNYCISKINTALSLWLETYQLTKDFKRRGIVEVKLS